MHDAMSSRSRNSTQEPETPNHLVRCERCRSLMRLLDEEGEAPAPTEVQLRRIRAVIIEDLKPVRPLPPAHVFLFACAIIFLSVVAVGALLLGASGWGALNMVQRTAIFATLAASAVLTAISMVGQMAPGNKYELVPAAL